MLADAGASIMELKKAGGWKSVSVVEEYVNDSIVTKMNIADSFNIGKPDSDSNIADSSVDTVEPSSKKLKGYIAGGFTILLELPIAV